MQRKDADKARREMQDAYREALKARARYLVFFVGMSKRGVSRELNVSLSTVQEWTKTE